AGGRVPAWISEVDAAEAWYRPRVAEPPEHRVFNLPAGRCPAGEVTAALRTALPDARITVGTNPGPPLVLVQNDRVRAELGFEPKFTIETALADFVRRFRARHEETTT